jgi:hypothetical protein
VPPGPQLSNGAALSATVYILKDGTEAGHMDRGAWDALVSTTPAGAEALSAAIEGPENRDVPLAWKAVKWDAASALARAEWPSGFRFGMGSTISSVRSAKPQFQRDIDFAWDQKLFSHFLLGASLHRSQFGGGLTRIGREVADTAGGRLAPLKTPAFWGDGYWWWSVSAGVPGLRYTLALASQPLPRYFWLESRPGIAIRNHANGRLISQWTGSSLERGGNLSQTLDARYGILRYGLLLDFDAYRVPVQTFACDDLPALFGTWGAGLIAASDVLATKVWADIPDLGLELEYPKAWPSHFRMAFLHLEFAYRNQRSFSLGLAVKVRIENPIMNRPEGG